MSKIVKFLQDHYPHCRDDIVRLEDKVLAAIDKVAKARSQTHVYELVGEDDKPAAANSEKPKEQPKTKPDDKPAANAQAK